MSKGLEALNRIKMLEISCDRESYDLRPITKTHKEDLKVVEKELKALEIIKEHTLYCENVDCFVFVNITKEVNDLLKEVLK